MGEEPIIAIEHLSKMYKLYKKPSDRLRDGLGLPGKGRYQEHYALRDVSFCVYEGECVGVIGVNGSGKSTLLKIITGVLGKTSGQVKVRGRISALLELGAGFSQEYTGMENIYLNGTMQGFTREEIEKRLPQILSFADIGEYIHQPVKTYSSGMFVRLAFALAINIDPEILIVDEALSVGDVFFQAKCYHKFEEFKKAGKTILFVSHDLSSVSKYCDRVVLLNQGVVTGEGSAKEMVDLYKQLLVGADPVREASPARLPQSAPHPGFCLNPKMLDYGTHQGEILDLWVTDEAGRPTNTIEKGTLFSITVVVSFSEEVAEPIVAYTFKNIRGTEITGTNTLFEGCEPIRALPGKRTKVTFTQKMTLQGGEYLLSFGCTGYCAGQFCVFHRLYDACNLTVVSDKNTVGFYDMESKIRIEEE